MEEVTEECFLPVQWVPYSAELATRILDFYVSGESFAKIARRPGMPAVKDIYRWHRDCADFQEEVKKARITRALAAEEKAHAIAETAESLDKDHVPGARLAYDIHRWGAEVNDPATYGKKTQISGDQTRPIVFQIISRIPEPEETPVEKLVEQVIESEFGDEDLDPPPDAA